jgi:hypothetical protein
MEEQRQSYTLTREPRADLYRAILGEALRRCDRVSLVQRSEGGLDASATRLLAELAPHLRQEQRVSAWPGTTLLGGQATLREYELVEATAAILARAAEGLYDWCQPSRPEDPVFWRPSGGPWLVTIAHERDAYFEITPEEREELLSAIPSLSTALEAG